MKINLVHSCKKVRNEDKKTHEIDLVHSYNKKVRNNQCKLLGVTLVIAYLSFCNKGGEFHEINFLHRKMYSARLLSKFEKNGM